jgi:long-chain acyl-CoA synthetase
MPGSVTPSPPSRHGREASRALDTVAAAMAEQIVLRRIRAVLGKGLRFLISGSAPMPLGLLERFHALGFLILEAYGMSESIVPVALNRPRAYKFGTVGRPLPPSEIRVAADGELLLRGPGVFVDYLGDRASVDRFDGDGFLATGDYARIDDDGFVTLLGRKSEVFKTSTGRRIAPAAIEAHLRRIPYVEHAVVFGANRPFLIGLIEASDASLRRWLSDRRSHTDPESIAAVVRADVASAVAELPSYERPAGVILCTRSFSITDGQLTPNLKVRRAMVETAFSASLDEISDAIACRPAVPLALVREGGTVILLSA